MIETMVRKCHARAWAGLKEEHVKLRFIRAAVAISTLATLAATTGALQKWGH
jgi:hypothetical protein